MLKDYEKKLFDTKDDDSIIYNNYEDTENNLINNIKVDKNYLFSKEATELIINNYEDLIIKTDFLNYLVENLTEYIAVPDYNYINSFLFPDEQSSITDDLIKKVLHNKNSALFDYYFKQLFKEIPENDYINKISGVYKINSSLQPKEIRMYYAKGLQIFLQELPVNEIEEYVIKAQETFKFMDNSLFINDLYNNFVVPALQNKIKEMSVETYEELKLVISYINKHPHLRYSRFSRILVTTYNLLTPKDKFYSYDEDILYDVQGYVETILQNDAILDYNLIYLCSYFDGKIDFRKSLNMIINILEGTSTISISKSKYQKIKEKTIDESLNYLEWILLNHNKDTQTDEFRETLKDFISYNWHVFTANNKSFINLKCMLRNYSDLEDVIDEVKSEQITSYKAWYNKYGPFTFATAITLITFAVCCYFGITYITRIVETISTQRDLVLIILAEVITAAILMIVMMVEKET